ncbi:MAG: hypothetical protein ACK5A0_12870 [Polaromonas sp.]|jgi:hypothetical protein
MSSLDLEKSRRVKLWVLITWPAFLAACLLEALVFAAVDPSEVHWLGQTVQPSRQAVYTAAFFSFWAIAMALGSLVLWLAKSPRDINDTARG